MFIKIFKALLVLVILVVIVQIIGRNINIVENLLLASSYVLITILYNRGL